MKGMLTPKFLTADVAQVAVKMAKLAMSYSPMVNMLSRQMFHIVVLVPSMVDDRAEDYPSWPNYAIEPHLLYDESVGDKEKWPHKFDDIAQCKALQLWHDRNDDRTDSMPHLLFPGDTPYWGGVKRRGIVVACSGVQPYFDKMISGIVADMSVAIAYHEWMTSDDKKSGVDFLI
jgi:hypothetical protein